MGLTENFLFMEALTLTVNIILFTIPLGVLMLVLLFVRAFYEGLMARTSKFEDYLQKRTDLAQQELERSTPKDTRGVH